MKEAIFNESDICVVNMELINKLKRQAIISPKRRFRFCMHQNHTDLVQEMIIVFCKDSHVPIHRHDEHHSESFHVIEGNLTVLLYCDDGSLANKVKLGQLGSGRETICRISGSLWHTIKLESEFVIIHETKTGPFDPEQKEKRPNWLSRS